MPATAPQVSEILAGNTPACNRGQLLPFTRHPKLLARVHRLRLQSCAQRVLEVLLTYADQDGVCWPQPDEIVQLMPRSARVDAYSMASVLRALRTLRALGYLEWVTIPPFGRFPGRQRGKRVWRGGRATSSGGRVWHIVLEKLRAHPLTRPSLSNAGTELGGAITHDRPRSITHDRPSDPWFSLRENKTDPARQRRAAPATPPASRVASETPGAATTRRRELGESPAPAPDASAAAGDDGLTARPTVAKKAAGETPRDVVAPLASRRGQGKADRDESNEGKEQVAGHARRIVVGDVRTPREVQDRVVAELAEILGVPVERFRR